MFNNRRLSWHITRYINSHFGEISGLLPFSPNDQFHFHFHAVVCLFCECDIGGKLHSFQKHHDLFCTWLLWPCGGRACACANSMRTVKTTRKMLKKRISIFTKVQRKSGQRLSYDLTYCSTDCNFVIARVQTIRIQALEGY